MNIVLSLVFAVIAVLILCLSDWYIKNKLMFSGNSGTPSNLNYDKTAEELTSAAVEIEPAASSGTASFILTKVERISLIFTAALFTFIAVYRLLGYEMSVVSYVRKIAAIELLCAVMTVDLQTHRIPNIFPILGIIAGAAAVAASIFADISAWKTTLLLSFISVAVCFIVPLILARIFHGGFGAGDIKLLASLGLLCGITDTAMLTFFAMLSCAFVAIFLLLTKKKKLKDALPFGPFLWLGYIIAISLGTISTI